MHTVLEACMEVYCTAPISPIKVIGLQTGENKFETMDGVVFSNEVDTNKLCVGQTCVTEAQLQQLLQNQGVGSGGAPSDPTSTPSGIPEVPPVVDLPPSDPTSTPPNIDLTLPPDAGTTDPTSTPSGI